MAQAPRDQNRITTLLGTSNADGITPVVIWADPVTHRLLVDLPGGAGTVTSVSVVSANGFAGSVANPTSTPAITISTTITGILKGDGTAVSAATAGTDYTALAFKTIAVSGQSDVVADSAADTLTLVGSGITITTNAATDTITFTAGGAGITIGTTTITSGTNTRILYDNSGVVGEYTLTGSGTVVAMQTSPVFVTDATTPVLKLSGTSNQVIFQSAGITGTLTWTPTSTGKTVTIPDRTLTIDNITTATTTSGTGFVKGNGSAISFDNSTYITGLTIGGTAIASGTNTRILYDNSGTLGEYTLTGSGTVVVMQNTPTLTTPVLGVATATSINKVALTAPATSATITITDGKTLAVTNTLTLSGTDSTVMTFPTTTATIARTDAAQTFTGVQTATSVFNTTPQTLTVASNAATADITHGIQNFTNSSAATIAITLTTTSAVDGQMKIVRIYDASAAAQTIGWTGTEDSTVTAPTTSNGSTTLPLTVGFQFNGATSKWRCIAKA